MGVIDTLRATQEIGSQQWGLVTSAQAKRLGVSPQDLKRAAEAGVIDRLEHGVYKDAGALPDPFEGVRVAWLRTKPEYFAYERIGEEQDFVVSGPTAAWLHEIGDLNPEPYELTANVRKQSRKDGVKYRRGAVEPDDVVWVQGVPVTSVERTLTDLLLSALDKSLYEDVVRDAKTKGYTGGKRLLQPAA